MIICLMAGIQVVILSDDVPRVRRSTWIANAAGRSRAAIASQKNIRSKITWPKKTTNSLTLSSSFPLALSLVLPLPLPGSSSFFSRILLPLHISLSFCPQIPSLGLVHNLLWMVSFLSLCEFCYYMQIPPFPANLAIVLVYSQWRPSGTTPTPGLSFLSAHLFVDDRLSRALFGCSTSCSPPL